MRVRSETQLVTFQNWTLRVRSSAAERPRLLFLLHGWTGDENSMWVFMRNFPADYWIVAPRAPYAAQPSGYSWRPPQAGPHQRPGLENLRPAVESLLSLADAYAAQNKLDACQLDLIGFSQGAALVNVTALLHPERVRRVGVLAGFAPPEAESLVEKRPLNGKPFFVAHGTQDEMVDIEDARRSVELLKLAGAQVTFCEDEVGHKLSVNCLRALETFFA